MQKIHIKSYIANFNSFYQQFSKALDVSVELIWSFQKAEYQLAVDQLMLLLMEDVDFILLSQSQLPYPHSEQLKVVGVFPSDNDVYDPIVLLALNPHKAKAFSWIESGLCQKLGKVNIAGFGPGNPDLLTVKAHRLIQEADIIYYDDLLDNNYLNQFKAEKVYVGKRKGQHSAKQEDINKLLFASALNGKKVLRLKGGDPLVFGRGAEEYHYLKRRFVEVEIVPGITSALAAASDAVIPLTARGTSTSVAFTLGHDAIYNKLPKADTLVFYMGASQQRKWAQRLIEEGWAENTPVAVVRNASLASKEIKRYTLWQLLSSEVVLPAPALLIVGQTASRDAETQNRKWLYTGTDINYFKGKGIVVHNPMINIVSQQATCEGMRALNNLKAFDRIVFASPFAVREFFSVLESKGMDVRTIANHQLSSIGASTSSELKKFGLNVSPTATDNSAAGLLASFKKNNIKGESMLLPCSDKGLSVLPAGLQSLGNTSFQLKLYTAMMPDNVVRHNLDDFEGIVFSSPTAVHHFFKLHSTLPPSLKVVARSEYAKALVHQYLETVKLTKVVVVSEE